MSALFAALFTAVATFELFMPSLMLQFGSPSPAVVRVPYGARVAKAGRAELFDVNFEHRRTLIPRGTVLSPDDVTHRAAVNFDASRRPPTASRVGSAFLLYLICCLILTSYAQRWGHGRLKLMRSQIGLYVLMVMVLVVAKLMLLFTELPAFWVPVAVVALWVSLGFDRRTGLLFDFAVAFFVASLLHFDVMLLSVLLTRGIVASLLFFNRKQPRQMLLAGLGGGLVAVVGYVSLTVLFQARTGIVDDLMLGLSSQLVACVGGGLLAGLLANILREPAELLMGHVSRSRLLDLTDIEAPLLRKMASEAPGSWEHSRAMANLAEAAAASIGADSLLTRVGAYYHDLGKTVQPEYFIENLAAGQRSPHDELSAAVSADAIMTHVVLGTKLLREGGVPEPVVEFAYTHHGSQLVEYFWRKYQENDLPNSDRPLEKSHFRYPGMEPLTKETAILMLVDAIEAASRTITPPEHAKFEEMIRRVVFSKLAAGQLDDSGLTITDLRIMSARMASALVNMYHGRIKYPWQRDKDREQKASAIPETSEPPSTSEPPAGDEADGDEPAADPDKTKTTSSLPPTDGSKTRRQRKPANSPLRED